MPMLFNAGPLTITAMFAGRVFVFAPNERKRINSFKDGDAIAHAEDAAQHMRSAHQNQGLILVDEENPMPMDEYKRVGRKAFLDWAAALIADLNSLNQKQAAQNLAIVFPTPEIRHIQKVAKAIAAEENGAASPEFISADELDSISKKEGVNTAALLRRALAALETGGAESAAAVLRTADIINQPGPEVSPPEAAVTDGDAGEPAAGSEDLDFKDPGRPVGTGMGRVPTRTGKRRG